jgi:hypothetical protein
VCWFKGLGTLKSTSELAQNGQKVGTFESSNSLSCLKNKRNNVANGMQNALHGRKPELSYLRLYSFQ